MAILTSIVQPNINLEIPDNSPGRRSVFKRKEKVHHLNNKNSITIKIADYVRSRNNGSYRADDTGASSVYANGKENSSLFDVSPDTFASSYNTSVGSVQETKHRFTKLFHSHSSNFWRSGRVVDQYRTNSMILPTKEEDIFETLSPLSDSWKLSSTAAERIPENNLTCYQKFKSTEFDDIVFENFSLPGEKLDGDDADDDLMEESEDLIEISPINSVFSFDAFGDAARINTSTPVSSPSKNQSIEKSASFTVEGTSFSDTADDIDMDQSLTLSRDLRCELQEKLGNDETDELEEIEGADLIEDHDLLQFTPLEGTPIFDDNFLSNIGQNGNYEDAKEEDEERVSTGSRLNVLQKMRTALRRHNSISNVSPDTKDSSYSPVSLYVPVFRHRTSDLAGIIDKLSNGRSYDAKENFGDSFCGAVLSDNTRLNIMDPNSFNVGSYESSSSNENMEVDYNSDENWQSYSRIKFDDLAELLVYDGNQTCVEGSLRLSKRETKPRSNKVSSAIGSALSYTNSIKRGKRICSVMTRFSDNTAVGDQSEALLKKPKIKPILKSRTNSNSQVESVRAQNCDSVDVLDFMTFFETHERRKIEAEPLLSSARAKQVNKYYQDLETTGYSQRYY